MSLVLAIDAGTTSVRAAVVDAAGRLAGLNAVALETRHPAPGLAEQDAEALWRATRAAMRRALQRSGSQVSQIAGLGLATQRASVVVWDNGRGGALSPLVLWSDLRGTEAAARLREAGFFLSAQQAAAKLPLVVASTERQPSRLAWGGLDSFLLHRLTGGELHASDPSQMWPTGYLALPDLARNTALIERQGLKDIAFPAAIETWGELGRTDPRVLGAVIPITASVADQSAALVAHGEEIGTAKFSWGTSGTFDLVTGGLDVSGLPALPPLVVTAFGGAVRFCIEGMILSAGSAVDWLRQTIRAGTIAEFERLVAQAQASPIGSGGIALLPALHGLGAPHPDPRARGLLAGLTAGSSRGQIALAGYEGLAFRARQIVERSGLAAGAPVGADGGLSRSPAFLQILADLTGRPVRPLASPEATLLGAALLARRGAGFDGEPGFRAGFAPRQTLEPAIGADEAGARFAAWEAVVAPRSAGTQSDGTME
ncbi:MAG TPA: FGGY-family carbohydrate kinase [Caulobacteraceae bacterium]|jgi:glycerol kinase|nr:FGGY-family carbohydrate kinase [Caulobacteraceae bacterium]